jgi:adenylyltransferase/sulfurtransferase
MRSYFEITRHPLEPLIAGQQFSDPRAGGICYFHGIIRNHNEGQAVKNLEYEADEAFCRAEANRILSESHEKFSIIEARALHRTGHLQIGETAIWAGVSAAHRQQAFKAVEYIVDEIKQRLPVWKKEHYVSGNAQWVRCRHLPAHHHQLTPEIYYSRQTNLSLIGQGGQKKLKQARVLVVGAGGLGNYALTHLAASGVGNLGICEHDTLAPHNLHRQTLYTTDDLRLPKALTAGARLKKINPFISVDVYQEKLSALNVDKIGRSYDLLIDGTDNFETKFLLNDYCVLNKKPLIQASIYQMEGQVSFYQPEDNNAACARCTWPDMPEPGCTGNCQQAGVAGFTPGILGTWQAAEAIKFILGLPVIRANETLFVNLLTNDVHRLIQKRNPDCPVCGPSASILKISQTNYLARPFALNPDDLTPRDWAGFTLIDIREQNEREVHPFPPALAHKHIPHRQLLQSPDVLDPATRYLLICASGVRSLKAAAEFWKKDRKNVYSLNDGISGLKTITATTE